VLDSGGKLYASLVFLAWSVLSSVRYWFGMWQYYKDKPCRLSSEQVREGPHDELGVEVSLQELDVGCSADHGVQASPLVGLVEIHIAAHECPGVG